MKLLKQLIMVLDENGIQVNKLNIEEGSIEVNKEITIVYRGSAYSLYTTEGKLSATNYYSLTEALEVLADYLNRVKEGTILETHLGLLKYKVIKHDSKDLYNLLDVDNDRLLYLECKSLDYIKNKIDRGNFQVSKR